jgi:hypothetical protein
VKRTAKAKSLALVERLAGVPLPRDAMLDVQVKRIHEVREASGWVRVCVWWWGGGGGVSKTRHQ